MIKIRNIYLLVGPSGVGKTTVAHELCKRYGLSEVISYTTRKRRHGEGNTHIFVNQRGFDAIRNELVAYTKFDSCEYGTPSSSIEENDLYVIDPSGTEYFSSHYKGSKQHKVILLKCDEDTCHARMLARGDKPLDIARRLANDKIAFKNVEDIADFTVNDYNMEDCINQIWDYIKKCERSDNT